MITVITIFRDAERFLAEAIESVLAQSYKAWELLLVDDGSVDRSTAIARAQAEAHPDRIRYLEHEGHVNRGMSASRNLGIASARGDLIALLDADDVWFPRRLEEQVAAFAAHPEVSLVYGNRVFWTSWAEDARLSEGRGFQPRPVPAGPERPGAPTVTHDSVSTPGIPADRVIDPPELFLRTYVERGTRRATNPGSDVMFRREAALAVGGFDERFRGMYEDQVFLVKMFLNVSIFVSSHCWLKYRMHEDSCSARSASAADEMSWRAFREWTDAYLQERGPGARELLRAYRKAARPRARWLERVLGASRRVRHAALAPLRRRV